MVIGNTEYFGNTLNTMHTHIYINIQSSVSVLYIKQITVGLQRNNLVWSYHLHTGNKNQIQLFSSYLWSHEGLHIVSPKTTEPPIAYTEK